VSLVAAWADAGIVVWALIRGVVVCVASWWAHARKLAEATEIKGSNYAPRVATTS